MSGNLPVIVGLYFTTDTPKAAGEAQMWANEQGAQQSRPRCTGHAGQRLQVRDAVSLCRTGLGAPVPPPQNNK